MPIIQIKGLPQNSGVDIPEALREVSCALAKVIQKPPHAVWATWEALSPDHYVEGANAAQVQPRDTHPPLVNLIAFEGASPASIEAALTCVADTLAKALGLEQGNVFVTYTEARAGRVYQGGQVMHLR